jgi:hypothetical protein
MSAVSGRNEIEREASQLENFAILHPAKKIATGGWGRKGPT